MPREKEKGITMGVAFILVGVLLCGGWYLLRRKSQASMQWPAVRGRVIASDVDRQRDSEGQWSEEARVVYEYVVGDTSFKGNRITFGGASSGNRAAARKTVERYPAGAEVAVYYDSAHPGSAVLERKIPGALLLLPVVGVIFAIVGIVALFAAR